MKASLQICNVCLIAYEMFYHKSMLSCRDVCVSFVCKVTSNPTIRT